jgi:hypothetical protein
VQKLYLVETSVAATCGCSIQNAAQSDWADFGVATVGAVAGEGMVNLLLRCFCRQGQRIEQTNNNGRKQGRRSKFYLPALPNLIARNMNVAFTGANFTKEYTPLRWFTTSGP